MLIVNELEVSNEMKKKNLYRERWKYISTPLVTPPTPELYLIYTSRILYIYI